MPSLMSICLNAACYVLSEHKHNSWEKKVTCVLCVLDLCNESFSKWQQPNIPAAVCVINVNQTRKDRENHSLLFSRFSMIHLHSPKGLLGTPFSPSELP